MGRRLRRRGALAELPRDRAALRVMVAPAEARPAQAESRASVFGLFAKKPPASRINGKPDAVYLDDASRLAAVAKEIHAATRPVTVLTPFVDHVAPIRDGLSRHGIGTATLDLSYRAPTLAPDEVYVVAFDTLPTLLSDVREPRDFIQVERHPLRAHDAEVDRLIEANSAAHRLRIRLALGDGLLSFFDADGSLANLMKRLDMPPDEAVEHALVTQSIDNAQAKVAKKVPSEIRASSFAQWRALNLGPGGK